MKQCKVCKTEKSIEEFGISKRHKDGRNPKCILCERQSRREYRAKNREAIDKKQREWYQNNKEHCIKKAKQYRIENIEKVKEYDKMRYHTDLNGTKSKRQTKEFALKRSAYRKHKRRTDPIYHLQETVRSAMRHGIKYHGAHKGTSMTWKSLPYTPQQLKEHLEEQFDEHMSWENYGSYWHIDHIYPQSRLPYDSMDHPNFLKCWSLDNLRPLEAVENMQKSDKIIKK